MSRKLFFVVQIILSACLVSCASKPKFEGTANLTGLVVDESNQPVQGFSVYGRTKLKTCGPVLTNESGIFVLYNVPCGKISIHGKKDGYVILDCMEEFFRRDKVFCFQVTSVDVALDKVEEKILQNDFDSALAILKKVYAKPKSVVKSVLREYRKIILSNRCGDSEQNDEIEQNDDVFSEDEVWEMDV